SFSILPTVAASSLPRAVPPGIAPPPPPRRPAWTAGPRPRTDQPQPGDAPAPQATPDPPASQPAPPPPAPPPPPPPPRPPHPRATPAGSVDDGFWATAADDGGAEAPPGIGPQNGRIGGPLAGTLGLMIWLSNSTIARLRDQLRTRGQRPSLALDDLSKMGAEQ